jgi:hypothetical protein
LQTARQQALHQVGRQHEQQSNADKRDADAIHKALTDMDKTSARLGEMAVAKTLRETQG